MTGTDSSNPTNDSTDNAVPTAIDEIDKRQNDVLTALDELNQRVEQLLAECTRKQAA